MSIDFYSTTEWSVIREEVLERDSNTCRYCGGVAYSADHVTPRWYKDKQGQWQQGLDTKENLVAVCKACNRLFKSRYFSNFEEKFAWYKRVVLDPWSEYLERVERADKWQRARGKRITEKHKRDGRKQMISEGKYPFHPSAHEHDYKCKTCAAVVSDQTACERGWPSMNMCDQCAIEQGIELDIRPYVPPLKMTDYDVLAKQNSDNESLYQLAFRKRMAEETANLTPEQKKEYRLKNADLIDSITPMRKICRSCGRRQSNYVLVDGVPTCAKGCNQKNGFKASNVRYAIKSKRWQDDPTEEVMKKHWRTKPKGWVKKEMARDLFSRRERNLFKMKHAEWHEELMTHRRVMRCCGMTTGEYVMIDGLPYCEDCKGVDYDPTK